MLDNNRTQMNEMMGGGGGGGGLRLRCHGSTLSSPLPSSLFPKPNSLPTPRQHPFHAFPRPTPLLLPASPSPSSSPVKYGRASPFRCSGITDLAGPEPEPPEPKPGSVDCVGTGADVECVVLVPPPDIQRISSPWWEWMVLVSPFFFWGTAMVAMKPILSKTGPLFVSAFRLIPAGLLLIAFAASQRRSSPSGLQAWLSISLFALVDASCFQVPPFPFFLLPVGSFFCFRPGLPVPFPC